MTDATKPTSEEIVQKYLDPMIEELRNIIFEPGYRASATKQDILGIAIAKYFEWAGDDIVQTSMSALSDANYHSLAVKLGEIANGEKV